MFLRFNALFSMLNLVFWCYLGFPICNIPGKFWFHWEMLQDKSDQNSVLQNISGILAKQGNAYKDKMMRYLVRTAQIIVA